MLQLFMYALRKAGVLGCGKTTLKNKLKRRYIEEQAHKRRIIFKYIYTTDDVERSIYTAKTYIWTSNFSWTSENRGNGRR